MKLVSSRKLALTVALGGGLAGATACGLDAVGSFELPTSPGTDAMAVLPPGVVPDASAAEAGDAASEAAVVACSLADGGGNGALCGGNCVDLARNHDNCGGCGLACPGSSACEGSCVAVAAALDKLRYELPCGIAAGAFCSSSPPAAKVVTLTGTASASYALTLRMRGVVEQKSYAVAVAGAASGTNAAFFITAGTPALDLWNTYLLKFSSPVALVYLNSGSSLHSYADAIDYTTTMQAAAGATVTLDSESPDSSIVRNRDQASGAAIVIAGVSPAPQPFDGQFVQVDVVSVALSP